MPLAAGRRLPLAYFVFAHLCLLTAFAAAAWRPASIAGFYYHPKMLAVVHLVTLGWITASILGALYMIVPLALGGRLPVGRADGWLFWGYVVGVTGMATHFWIDEPVGMTWAAGMAALAALSVVARAATALRTASLPPEVALHFRLAFANLALAAALGVAMGVDKLRPLLPGRSLDHVLAHAHLAAVGWATMTVMAAGYRLLPMLLPAKAPRGGWLWLGATTMELGVLGVAASLYLGRPPLPAAVLLVAALGLFLSRVVWMLRHRRPPPPALERPEPGIFHVAAALAWLVVAALLGLVLAGGRPAPWRQGTILVYGAAGLVGFLSQIVVGVAGRLVPLWLWMGELASTGAELASGGLDRRARRPSPYRLADRRLALAVVALWTAGVPLLAAGLGLDRHAPMRAGAALLALAAGAGLLQLERVRRAARRPRDG